MFGGVPAVESRRHNTISTTVPPVIPHLHAATAQNSQSLFFTQSLFSLYRAVLRVKF